MSGSGVPWWWWLLTSLTLAWVIGTGWWSARESRRNSEREQWWQ